MTVQNTTSKVERPGDGTNNTFSFSPLVVYEPQPGDTHDFEVSVVVIATGETESVLTEGSGTSNYSVSISGYPGTGDIIYPASGASRLPSTKKLVIKRVVKYKQTTNFSNNTAYFAEEQERLHDLHVMRDIDLKEKVDRAIAVPIGDPRTSDQLLQDIFDAETNASASASAAAASETAAAASETAAAASEAAAAASATAAAASAGSGLFATISDKSASFSITADVDNAVLFKVNSAGGNIIASLPSIADAYEGERYGFMRTSTSNTVTLARNGTDTINGVAGDYVIPAIANDIYLIVADEASPNNWIVIPWAQVTADGTTISKTGSVLSVNLNNPNTWTAPQRAANAAANAGSFDMSAKNDFTCTPTGAAALTFTSKVSGQRGMILLNNTSNYAITRASGVEADESFNDTVSATGKYLISYWCYDGTNVALSYSGAIS